MAKSSALATGLLALIFNNTALANIGNAGGLQPSGVAGSLFMSLHTADPGLTGASEAAYGAYARQAVARSSAGFTVSGPSVTLFAATNFPAATSGSETELFFGAWTAISGGTFLYGGALGSNLGAFTGIVAGNAITIPGLGALAVNDRIVFFPRPGDTLPTNVVAGTVYFVLTVSGNVVTIGSSLGGGAITIGAAGDGVAMRVTPVVVTTGVTPSLTTGLTITEN
jgi:hypothetical protein